MSVLATDPFTRTDAATLGASWAVPASASEGFGVLSNQAKVVTVSTEDASYYAAVPWPNDQYSQVSIVALTAFTQGVTVREAAAGASRNRYVAGQDANDFGGATTSRIFKWVNSIATSLGTGSTTLATGQTWYLEVRGANLKMKINGVTEITVADGSLANGNAGLFAFHNVANVAVFDTWEGGDFPAYTVAVDKNYLFTEEDEGPWSDLKGTAWF